MVPPRLLGGGASTFSMSAGQKSAGTRSLGLVTMSLVMALVVIVRDLLPFVNFLERTDYFQHLQVCFCVAFSIIVFLFLFNSSFLRDAGC